jgi:hypothetical protein
LYGESQFYSQLSERAPAIGEYLIGKAVRWLWAQLLEKKTYWKAVMNATT